MNPWVQNIPKTLNTQFQTQYVNSLFDLCFFLFFSLPSYFYLEPEVFADCTFFFKSSLFVFTTWLEIHIFSYPVWVSLETGSSHKLIQDPLLFFNGRAYGTGPVKVHQGQKNCSYHLDIVSIRIHKLQNYSNKKYHIADNFRIFNVCLQDSRGLMWQ